MPCDNLTLACHRVEAEAESGVGLKLVPIVNESELISFAID